MSVAPALDHVEDLYRLSPIQRSILFYALYAPRSGLFVEQLADHVEGRVDGAVLRRVWARIVERHPVLRTSFHWEDLDEPLQMVQRQAQLRFVVVDWRRLRPSRQETALRALVDRDRERGYDLASPPLMRLYLIRRADDRHLVLWSFHHILLDAWAAALLLRESLALYPPLARGEEVDLPRPRPYRDYIGWLHRQDPERPRAFWRRHLAGFTESTVLSVDRAPGLRPSQDLDDGWAELRLSAEATASLVRSARRGRRTVSSVVLAAWALLVSRYAGRDDVCLGYSLSGRPPDLPGVEEMVGVFVNSLPVRIRVGARSRVRELLAEVHERQMAVQHHQYTALSQVREWSELPRGVPLFETLMVFENFPGGTSQPTRFAEKTSYPLNLLVALEDELSLRMAYDKRRFTPAAVERLLRHLRKVLLNVLAEPDAVVGRLSLLGAAERQQVLLEWNGSRSGVPELPVHRLVQEQSRRRPDAVAVQDGARTLTYRQLDAEAARLAARLASAGVRLGEPVGLAVERSLEMVVGYLGVLRAGAVCVPLDPHYPEERLATLLDDLDLPVLVTAGTPRLEVERSCRCVLRLDRGDGTRPPAAGPSGEPQVTLDDLSFLLFTSGSTGRPKGVELTHRGLVNYVHQLGTGYRFGPADRVLQFASPGFDAALEEVFLALVNGARLVLRDDEMLASSRAFFEACRRHAVTVLDLPTAWWHQLALDLDGAVAVPETVRLVIIGGEQALPQPLHRWRRRVPRRIHLLNAYGPTEITVAATLCDLARRRGPEVAIGRPLANDRVYLLDAALAPVPMGLPGELFLGGWGLARGYHRRPAATAERFVPDPFCRRGGGRLYRTGDRARFLDDGALEFLGRLDRQLKVRGFRVEPAEIESALEGSPQVRRAAVDVGRDSGGEPFLVAYVVAEEGEEVDPERLRADLARRLPDYMVPVRVEALESLPLTAHGKLDRKALPAPRRAAADRAAEPPATELERGVAAVWQEVLGLERVGADENFFALGGHSLSATRVISRLRRGWGIEVPMRSLYDAPTVRGLAREVERRLGEVPDAQAPALVAGLAGPSPPLSYQQEQLWFVDQIAPAGALDVAGAGRIDGPLDVGCLRASFREVLRRHQVLRGRFAEREGRPVCSIGPVPDRFLARADLSRLPPPRRSREARRLFQRACRHRFDLAAGGLVQGLLVRLGPQEHRLLVVMHHIVSDAWSAVVFLRELVTLYTASSAGRPSPLPELPVQYADYAAWQRRWLTGEVLARRIDHWRRRMAGAPTRLDLPMDRPRPQQASLRGGRITDEVAPELLAAVDRLGHTTGSTRVVVLLAAFVLLLHELTGRRDLVVGMDVANRSRAEVEGLIGFFVNLLPLRLPVAGERTFGAVLADVRDAVLDAQEHQEVPFDKLVEALNPPRSLSHAPLVQVVFSYQRAPGAEGGDGPVHLTPLPVDTGTEKRDLTVFVLDASQRVEIVWSYSKDLFDAAGVERFSCAYLRILAAAVERPDLEVSVLGGRAKPDTEAEMDREARDKSRLDMLLGVEPKRVAAEEPSSLVHLHPLQDGGGMPLVVEPVLDELDPVEWVRGQRQRLDGLLSEHGALLFRGFDLDSVAAFERFARAATGELFSEYGDLPREPEGGQVYAATPYPAEESILFHNEGSHTGRWPMKQWFYCVQPARRGGATPLVDCRHLLRQLDEEVVETFRAKGLMYVRNFTSGLDRSWQQMFGCDDRATVERHCRRDGIDLEWLPDGGLRTRQIRPAVASHPRTGEPVFFNQILLHHESTLEPEVRRSLRSLFGGDGMPRNVLYGDGTPIPDPLVADLLQRYRRLQVAFPWQRGDVLLVDNMLVAHARDPYEGPRKIVVAMGAMATLEDLPGAG